MAYDDEIIKLHASAVEDNYDDEPEDNLDELDEEEEVEVTSDDDDAEPLLHEAPHAEEASIPAAPADAVHTYEPAEEEPKLPIAAPVSVVKAPAKKASAKKAAPKK